MTRRLIAGENDAEWDSRRDLREREGKCPSCGATTHKYMRTKSGAFGWRKKMKKVPLTLAGQCRDGRCLTCDPIMSEPARPMERGSEMPSENICIEDAPGGVASEAQVPALIIGEDIIIEGCEGMDLEEVEQIVAEEVERILAETQNKGAGCSDDNISNAIEGLEIQMSNSQNGESYLTKETSVQENETPCPKGPQVIRDQKEVEQAVEGFPKESPDVIEGLSGEIPCSVIEVRSPKHKQSESSPAVFDSLQRNPLDGDAHGGEWVPPLNQHFHGMSENDIDAWDNGSLDYTCGNTHADFAPALVAVSDGSEEDTRAGSGPSLPSREVLDEIHGLARAFDHKMAHRHLVKLRTLSIQYQRRVEISKAGGVQAIISSLKRFGKDSGSTAKQAFAALQNLASIDSIARSIAQNKGIPAIVEAMEIHYKCPGVQEHGCAALRNLTSSNIANRTQVGEAGGIRTVIGAMRYHANSAKICDKAVAALGNFSLKHPENRRTIGKEGGISAILHAMRKHDGYEGVSEKGMQALWDLVHNVLNVELLRDEDDVSDFTLGVGVRFPRRCKEKAVQIYLKL
eukprot:CAMPEP_0113536896 /NCGR_PEP_ID=MMETSP0015_2-20120614/6526_1 /TAXON_ID=2838 /ORGANISM="Odontella" /LENGTH=570 /DNA_ID=CAMNT_0000436333 /DNA_START=61 /DNA_END=1773 /DNA_ORIENTATION=+ /assembly_acc=CAM_ASM_000160